MGNFNFKTGFYEERGSNGYRMFHTCIFDYGSDDINIIWYVPGMKGWVVAGKMWNYPRMRQDVIPQYMDGCLRYSVDPPIYAEFSGIKPEQRLANDQASRKCEGLGGEPTPIASVTTSKVPAAMPVTPRTAKLTSMSMPLSAFFPSDLSRPHNTMLKFRGVVDLIAENEGSYTSRIRYEISRVEGRPAGDPSSVRLRPMFRGAAERLYSYFRKSYPNGFVPLGKAASRNAGSVEGQLEFHVLSSAQWVFAPAIFAFVDRDDRVLAQMEIPAFAPQSGNR